MLVLIVLPFYSNLYAVNIQTVSGMEQVRDVLELDSEWLDKTTLTRYARLWELIMDSMPTPSSV